MTDYTTRQEQVAKLADLIRGIRTAMLTTLSPAGYPRSRPMATQEVDFDGTVWFFSPAGTRKVQEISIAPTVSVTYSSPGKESYVSLTGQALVTQDAAKARELWNPLHKAWFEGPDDPQLRIIRVDVQEAEYWDTPGGKIASLFQLAKAAVTGKRDDPEGDNVKVQLG